jgi:hypothetical protein
VGFIANEPSVGGLDAPLQPATPSHIITNDERQMLRFDMASFWWSVRKNEKFNSVQKSS